jgi:hypothetical protein
MSTQKLAGADEGNYDEYADNFMKEVESRGHSSTQLARRRERRPV